MPVQDFSIILKQKIALTHNVLELTFSQPENLVYEAGQFMQLLIPDGEKFILRSYSLASTPADEDLKFCVKIIPGGKGSELFAGLSEGETITVRGPRGVFCNRVDSPVTCVATGAGMAPIMGIIRDELENKKNTHSIKLLFGVREEKDVFWQQELKNLKNKFAHFTCDITLSQPQNLATWSGLTGRVTEHANKLSQEGAFFLCGNPEMVKEMRTLLLANGTDPKQIHFEIF